MNRHKPSSLRLHLFFLLSASTLLVWAGVSWFMHERLVHEVGEVYDAQLHQLGRILARLVRVGFGEIELALLQASLPNAAFDDLPGIHSVVDKHPGGDGRYERLIGFQVVDGSGRILSRSPGAPETVFSRRKARGFDDSIVDGSRWRVCILPSIDRDRLLYVGEQYSVRQEISTYLLRSMRTPILLGILAIGILIWLSLARGLKPLSELAKQVRERKPTDIRPIEAGSAPREIVPVVQALNSLLVRLREAFENERRFTGDAAHELRTPLAGLKVQSQVALRSTNEEERNLALEGIMAGVDRTAHLVSQLLVLSRLDWQEVPECREPVGLYAAAEAAAAELAESAGERGISIAGSGDRKVCIYAERSLLSILIRNLFDNAVRYSDAGDDVFWSVTMESAQVLLSVTDEGPGIPESERQRVFDRFHRLPGSEGSGAGLGLSIVCRIADLYGAGVSLADPPAGHGLTVQVSFPLEPSGS